MFSTANYVLPAQHNMDHCVSHTPPPETGPGLQEAASIPLIDNFESAPSKDFRNSMNNVFKNMFKINVGVVPHAKVSMNVTS